MKGGKLPGSGRMTKNDSRQSFFGAYSKEDWEKLVVSSLKGRPLQDLHTATYEGITLQPLYTEWEPPSSNHPSRWWSQTETWHVAQQVQGMTIDNIIDRVKEEIEKGTEVISLRDSTEEDWRSEDVKRLLSIQSSPHLFITEAKIVDQLSPFLIEHACRTNVMGVLGYDFLSQAAVYDRKVTQDHKKKWAHRLNDVSNAYPNVKSIVISTVPYHQAGANAVQELSAALAEAAWYIDYLSEEGWTVNEVVRRMHIQFATGSTFFLEVAKLRAFRALWSHFMGSYNVDMLSVSIGTESSSFNKTIQDPHVNILRSGNEAFAAALGGVNYQHVEPFNTTYEEPTGFSARIARNIQLILKKEVFLDGLMDPAGGSYYVESLTKQLSDQAWQYFLLIEDHGGIEETLVSGWLQNQIDEIWKQRQVDVATRKKTIVGTNRYAPYEKNQVTKGTKNEQDLKLNPLRKRTIGQDWEALLSKVLKKQYMGQMAAVQLVCLGSLKEYKPRADFVQGILSAAGINWTYDLQTNEPVQIICGTNQAYENQLDEILHEKTEDVKIYIAGKPAEEKLIEWQEKGLNGVIYDGMNVIQFLDELVQLLEVEVMKS
ncbi:methylmalonyl-CoA mutase family protein [Jeotgalibacillus soli]|uniref:Methylmalonyl-CoA mutase alpha/beta chain catalytic domain-containing protein n=1 Tax=Jeotgalibacillus soli TaxID=889306 RepID=A0A0C2R1X3_9BACL|nr:methylmalonyl-CoA mutase family protein [Jeotgalibacillus soli]KIL44315.1 hypothetical protein KP78_32790 [Jeotgalibacillus soli]